MEHEQTGLSKSIAEMDGHTHPEITNQKDIEGVWLTVNQAVNYCASLGLVRTNKTVRRWAHRSITHPEAAEVIAQKQDTETDFRYIIERSSLDVKIKQELRFEAQSKPADISQQDPTSSNTSGQVHTPPSTEKPEIDSANQSGDVQTGADTVGQVAVEDAGTGSISTSASLLHDQISEKDRQINKLYKQLERRDEQIMAMLERDRETNILIKGLQEALLPSVEDNPPSSERRRLDVRSESFVDDQSINTPAQTPEQIDTDDVQYKI